MVTLHSAPGFAKLASRPARNAGVAAASSPVLAFTDTDCSPDPAWLEEGLKALARFDVVGGAITVTVGAAERPTPVECFERVFAFKNRDYIEKQGYTVTDNMLTRRDLFDKVGGFVTTTIAEDVEWGRRVKRAGFTLGYAPAALDSHPARRDWPERSKKWKRILLQQFNETQACSHPRLRWLMRNFAILLSPLVHMFEVIRSDRLTGASQRLAAALLSDPDVRAERTTPDTGEEVRRLVKAGKADAGVIIAGDPGAPGAPIPKKQPLQLLPSRLRLMNTLLTAAPFRA